MPARTFYTETQRRLQDEFGSRGLADRVHDAIVTRALNDAQIAFIGARDMLFLSTVDEDGFPSCSYKGGAPGFVRIADPASLVFPNYDGNGMFLSQGNIEATARVGLLFIDFGKPQRMRVRGTARLLRGGPWLRSYPGALTVTHVAVERVWQNCPRYVHRMQPEQRSAYLPADDGSAPLAPWKRIDVLQDVLTEAERREAAELGLMTAQMYAEMEARGEV